MQHFSQEYAKNQLFKVQSSRDSINKNWGCDVPHDGNLHSCMRVHPKSFYHKENRKFFFLDMRATWM